MSTIVTFAFYSPTVEPVETMLSVYGKLCSLAPARSSIVDPNSMRRACEHAERIGGDYFVAHNIELHSGRTILASLYFSSTKMNLGAAARQNGQVRLIMDLRDLCGPLYKLIETRAHLENTDRAVGEVCEEICHFVSMLCCADDTLNVDECVQHAAMFLESGWASPVGCSMVYHHNIYEFVADFERIYHEYWIGGTVYEMLNPGAYLHPAVAQSNGYVTGPKALRPDYYDDFEDEGGPLLPFVLDISMEDCKRMRQLAMHEVLRVFDQIADEHEYELFSCGSNERGVLTLPGNGLGPFYRELWDSLKRES